MSNSISTENKNKNFNKNKKFNNKPKNPNEIVAPLHISKVIDENIYIEILNVLASTKFNKVSIPIGIYKNLLDSNIDSDDMRITTVGYIRNYDSENNSFTVIIFKGFMDYINKHKSFTSDLLYTETRKGTLGTITKFVINPSIDEVKENSSEEDTNSNSN